MRSRLLITGATGLIGRHLLAVLAASTQAPGEVIPWDRVAMGSLLRASDQRAAIDVVRPTVLLHLAWSSTQTDDYDVALENYDWASSGIELARECINRGIWFIATGSAADTVGDGSFQSPYSAAKRQFRSEVQALSARGRTTWLRPQYVVSIEDRRPRVVRAYLDRGPGSGFKLLDPDRRVDFIHVDDVASGIALAIEHGLTGTVDLGSGTLHSARELLAALDRFTSPEASRGSSRTPSASLTRPDRLLDLGWQPVRTQALFGDRIL